MTSQLKQLKPATKIGRTIFTRGQRAHFSTNGLKVLHNTAESEFTIHLDTHKAFLKYQKNGDLIELEHTEVPEVFRGKGVGKLLAQVKILKCLCCSNSNN